MKGDRSRLPSLTPETLRSARPAGPVRFSLNDAPERERPELYRDFFGRTVMGVDVEPLDDGPFEAEIMLQSLTDLQLLEGRVHGSHNRRTREMLADGRDYFSLMVNLGGPYVVSQGKDEIVLGDGEATLVSTSNPCSFAHRPPGDVLALRLPRRQFQPFIESIDDCCLRRIPHGAPALKLLKDYVEVAWDERRLADAALQNLFVAHVYDLIAVAVGATRETRETAQGRGLRAARLHAIKRDIANNLNRANLSAAALAKRHGCSLRLVQRLFESEGTTFTEYVLAQRLARARRMLMDPRRKAEKISAVAYDCGFGDLSYFNRAFRQCYSTAPSDVRAQTSPDASDSACL